MEMIEKVRFQVNSLAITMAVLISINVYKLPDFIENQIRNISEYVTCSHTIILNCNDSLYAELKQRQLPDNVVLNPDIINKTWMTGSVIQGIVSNMNYAVNRIPFKFFIVLSGRTIFYKKMGLTDLLNCIPIKSSKGEFPDMNWWWPIFRKTMLMNHYLNLGYTLRAAEHEGICFSFETVQQMTRFLNEHSSIALDLYSFKHCVEEFALPSLACNEGFGFFTIGHGVTEDCNYNLLNKFTRKIAFPS
jgi:hypothetical protein